MSDVKRQLFLRVNRFQRPIINVVIAASCVTVVLGLCVFYLYFDTTNAIISPNREIPALKIVVLLILLALPIVFYLIIVSAYKVSNKLLGPFERIISELDTLIEKREKRHLSTRKGDELAEELLKRVNTLIDRLP